MSKFALNQERYMIKEFSAGIFHFVNATAFLRKHRLLYFYLFPLLIGLLFYAVLGALILMFARDLTEQVLGPYIPDRLPEYHGFFKFLNALGTFSLHSVMSFIAGIVIFLVSSRFSKYIILILLSPVFSVLSEKTDELVSGKSYPFSVLQFLKDIVRGSLLALRNLFLELILIAVFSIAGIFAGPLAFLIAPLLWVIGAYFYGFSMVDYTCERRKMSISEGNAYIRKRWLFVCGNGIMYTLCDMLPYVGTILAPVNGVVGATSGLLELENKEAETVL